MIDLLKDVWMQVRMEVLMDLPGMDERFWLASEKNLNRIAGALVPGGEEPVLQECKVFWDGAWKAVKVKLEPHRFGRLAAGNPSTRRYASCPSY